MNCKEFNTAPLNDCVYINPEIIPSFTDVIGACPEAYITISPQNREVTIAARPDVIIIDGNEESIATWQ